ncbi:MAG TPA: site-2 protease family protein [Desulfomonilaceae bacterium]|nr:site-2 protease family protein [Desulfomonilaceae bacterium]
MGFDFSTIIRQIVLIVPGFLLAITVHEFTHGYVAYRLGDPTAKLMGRLTLNPISHLDPFGTLALILTQMIGWAKPVPVDPRYLRNPRRDMLWISLGGPAANLVTAILLSLVLHAMVMVFGHNTGEASAFVLKPLFLILFFAMQINVGLAIFNLIPVPPLDGSKILAGLLPRQQAYQFEQLEPYGFIILMILIISGAVTYFIVPPIRIVMAFLMAGIV